MKIRDKVVVVTGGASGIGRALCRSFAAEGAKGIVVSDYNGAGAAKVAEEIGGLAVTTNVGNEAQVQKVLEFFQAKANHYERWLRHMRCEQKKYVLPSA